MIDERERDQLWKRIDQHGRAISALEKESVRLDTRAEDHSRQLSDLSRATISLNHSVSQMVGGMRSLKAVGIALAALISVIEIAEAIGKLQ